MSDTSQGEGWWLASDGKWYPPESRPPPPGSAPVPMEAAVRRAGWLLVAGAAAAGIGSFMPWVVITAPFVGQVSKSGIDGDGVITLALAVGLAVFGFRRLAVTSTPSPRAVLAPAVVTLLLLGITVVEVLNVSSATDDLDQEISGLVSTSYGAGLYLLALGAITGGVGCLLLYRATMDR